MSKLFDAYKIGDIALKNRIVMAPMTRSRASADGVLTDLTALYYGQRAGAGLIISEATAVSKQGSGYPNIPGIWNEAQTQAWAKITRAVHDKSGKIFLQMFHTGRYGHTSLLGEQPVSPGTKPPGGQVMGADYAMHDFETPRALKTAELPGIVAQFKTGAENAKKAGFDGIEIHAANGYILDQFLRDGVNDRTDQYGGSSENRARLLREVTEEAVAVWGADKVGVRLSPYNAFNTMSDSDPMNTFTAVAKILNELPLAYLHLVEPISDKPRVADEIREFLKHSLIVNGGMTKESGGKIIAENQADLIAYGVPFIANPDLVARFRAGLPLAQADPALFYTGGEKGYVDYPPAGQKAA